MNGCSSIDFNYDRVVACVKHLKYSRMKFHYRKERIEWINFT